jgi:hypothetical protein
MMTPREEAEDLLLNPLPDTFSDVMIPTRIAALDVEIAETIDKLKDLQSSRDLLLDHAVKTNHMEDSTFKIEVNIKYGARVASGEKLRENYPKQFSLYVMAIANKKLRGIVDVAEKATIDPDGTIELGIADKIFGKKNVDACSVIPETKVYNVVKKK